MVSDSSQCWLFHRPIKACLGLRLEVSSGYRPERYGRENFEKMHGEGHAIARGSGRKSKLSLQDQLLLTLMRLRLGRMEKELAYHFGIDEATVSRILKTWLNFLYLL